MFIARHVEGSTDAYIDHESIDIICEECRSLIASLHADRPDVEDDAHGIRPPLKSSSADDISFGGKVLPSTTLKGTAPTISTR
jgi:hypothetical protein